MYEYFIVIIITLLILFLVIYIRVSYTGNCSSDKFTVPVNDLSSSANSINLVEKVDYPCTGCLTYVDKKIKPYFMYNSLNTEKGDRCFYNKSGSYIQNGDTTLNNLINYSVDPSSVVPLASCTDEYNSMYDTVNGRYIKIKQSSNTTPHVFRLVSISVNARQIATSPLSNNAALFFVNNTYVDKTGTCATNPTDNCIFHAFMLKDGTNNNWQSSDITTGPLTELLIDLGSTQKIGFIKIVHKTTSDYDSLNGATILIMSDPIIPNQSTTNTLYSNPEKATIVWKKTLPSPTIPSTTTDRIIYTYGNGETVSPSANTESIIYSCNYILADPNSYIGFVLPGDKLIKDFRYEYTSDSRCFKPKTDAITHTQLKSAINKTSTITDITNNFYSCSTTTDTRASLPLGRYIRLTSSAANKILKVRQFSVKIFSNGNTSDITPVDVHVKPYSTIAAETNYNYIYDPTKYSLDPSVYPGVATSSLSTVTSYIQLDLGQTYTIKEITITAHSSEVANPSYASGSLAVIQDVATTTGYTVSANVIFLYNIPSNPSNFTVNIT